MLAIVSTGALLWIVLPSDTESQYIARESKIGEKKGFRGSVEWTNQRRVNQETGIVDAKDIVKAHSQISALKSSKASLGLDWKNMGPTNIGGRTRALLIDNNDATIMYAGGVSGGLWKSTTSGGSWTQINYTGDSETNDIPNLAIASICQTIDGDIYFGTGEGHYKGTGEGSRGIEGAGIWKSTDGETFTRISSTWNDATSKETFSYVNKLAADPNNNNRIFAATIKGIRLTEDGGETWTNPVTTPSGVPITSSCGNIKISTDGDVLIADLNKYGYLSHEGGAIGTWENISGSGDNQLGVGARLEFAIAPSDPNYIYCQAAKGSDGSLLNVYRSTDGGYNWDIIGYGGSEEFNPLGEQGTYDNTIAVFPDNKNEIILGGQFSIWKWSNTEGWHVRTFWSLDPSNVLYVHADQHEIIFDPNDSNIVYVGSDGGIHRSLNRGITWQTLNKNYNVTQFYGIGYSPTNELIGGTQDNGTVYMDPDVAVTGGTQHHYTEVTGGDGGTTAISQLNPNIIFSTIYFGQLFRSEERGAEETMVSFYSTRLSAAVSPGDEESGNNFITPIALWESFNDVNSLDTIKYVNSSNIPLGTEILVESESVSDRYIDYTTTQSYVEGDTILVVDTYQAMLAVGFNGSVWITREPLNFKQDPAVWFPVADTIGKVETLAWSKDGNNLYFANTSGVVYRVSGFNNAYTDSTIDCSVESSCVLTTTKIAQFNGRFVTDVAVDPSNADNVIVTLGQFGNSDYVYYSSEGTTATETSGLGTFTSIQGNLPQMPVYTAVVVWNDSNKIIVGTEYGVFATENISANSTTWTDENNNFDYVPVYDLQQQTFPNGWISEINKPSGIRNHGYIWAGTHGRGIFQCSTFEGPVGIKQNEEIATDDMNINLFPNPATDIATINFELDVHSNVSVMIFDMQGRMVNNFNYDNLSAGSHNKTISVSNMKHGTYIVKLVSNNNEQYSKIVVE